MPFPLHSTCSRRAVLGRALGGFGGVALAGLLAEQAPAAAEERAPGPHFPPRAKRVVLLWLPGGPSHVDLFDPKPDLFTHHDKTPPGDAPSNGESFGLENVRLLRPIAPFGRYGRSGLELSTMLPELGSSADDLCILRGVHTDNSTHEPASLQFHTGFLVPGRPAMGAWVCYGLGSENRNLPGFLLLGPGPRLGVSAFLPAKHQATSVSTPRKSGKTPVIPYLVDGAVGADAKRAQFDLIQNLNRAGRPARTDDLQMDGMISSLELAFEMQAPALKLGDLSQESQATLDMYGVDQPGVDETARKCIFARRCVEAGVRFVALQGGEDWDQHGDIAGKLPGVARSIDRPFAALVKDLKQRGLLDDTLVVCGGEFGRTPTFQLDPRKVNQPGREHNRFGYTMWLAGGGLKRGIAHGATDPLGFRAIEGKVHIHDLHATILHLLGLDHTRLTYRHAGRQFRLTDVEGEVVRDIIL